jgi:hypothetical protein
VEFRHAPDLADFRPNATPQRGKFQSWRWSSQRATACATRW